ncbi:MAG: hypothetical protein IAE79_18315 [Anaerolinea sp.]|nr:hypothetical protein [Anaerolinea sp.]
MTELPLTNPYVGPRTFTKEDRGRFFGREQEARNLLSLVISERLVLFYAQSGAGKSSLLNTRLIPRLVEDEGFVALPVGRVSGEIPPGVAQVNNIFVFNLILSLEQSQGDPNRFAHMTLSDFLQHLTTADGETYSYDENVGATAADATTAREYEEPPHILIIDQFEEIITTHLDRWQEREYFFRQLNQALLDDPLLWVTLTLREDFVAALRPYERTAFNFMRARFYMKRMEAEAAQQAIEKPADMAGRPFAAGVAANLADNLRQIRVQGEDRTQPGQFVEPVQLQVVCYQLWENLRGSHRNEITQQDLDELGNVDTALSQYYEQAIAKAIAATGVSEVELRNWFDRQLVTEAETRGTVYQGETETAGMENEVVRVLANQFLLRPEIRAGGAWYELVHDRFIAPILSANQTWRLRQSPLLQAAEAWDRANRSRSKLTLGEELKGILATIDRRAQEPLVQEFLTACEDAQSQQDLAAAQAEAEEQSRRAEAKTRIARRLRALSIGLGIAIIFAIAFAVISLVQANAANANARLAATSAAEARTNAQLAATSAAEARANARLAATREQEALANAGLAATSATQARANENLAVTREAEAVSARATAVAARATSEYNAELAKTNTDKAEKLGQLALAQSLAAQAPRLVELNNDTELATLLALEALRITQEQQSEDRELVDAALREVLSQPGYNTVLHGHDGFVTDAEIDPNGRFLASIQDNGALILWDLDAASSNFQRLSPAAVSAQRVRFSPDGQTMVVLRRDRQIVLWDVSGLAAPTPRPPSQLATFAAANNAITNIQFTADGRFLFAYGANGPIWRWDVATPETPPILLFSGADAELLNLAISADGRYLATYIRGSILIRDLNSASRAIIRSANSGNGVAITQGIFAQDSRFLVTADANGSITMWNMTVSDAFPATRFTPTFPPPIGGLDVSHDGNTIAVIVEQDLSICLLNGQTPAAAPACLRGHNSGINAVSFSPSDAMLVSASDDRALRLWQLAGAAIAPEILRGYETDVVQASFGGDGRFLTTLTQNLGVPTAPRQLSEWDLSQSPSVLQQRITLPASETVTPPFAITNLIPTALHAGRQLIATTDGGAAVNIWSYAAGDGALALQVSLTADGTAVTALTFSADGQQIAAATTGKNLYLWNLAHDEPQTLSGFRDRLHTLVFSPDRRYLAAADEGNSLSIYVWDLQGDLTAPRVINSGHELWVGALAFSADGRLLASAGYDDLDIHIWNLDDPGEPARTFSGHADWVLSLAFSPDGHVLASGSWDRTIRLWDLGTPENDVSSSILKGHERQVRQVSFSPAGDVLASASQDNTARLWIVGIEQFAAIGCEEVRRNLSLDEWVRYVRGIPKTYALTCPNRPIHPSFIKQIIDLAHNGDLNRAQQLLARAMALDPTLALDLETAVANVANREQARQLVMDALVAAVGGEVETAVAAINEALSLDPNVPIDEWDWNDLCWYGSLWGFAADVLFACDNAIALDASNASVLDSRGLARALAGDVEGAIADFTAYVQSLRNAGVYEPGGDGREAWIAALRAGQNPFTEELLAALREE